eukprot:7824817-Karenia_brevis.AAC.1
MSSDRPPLRSSLNNGATNGHCSPFWNDEMAVLKLITLGDKTRLRVALDTDTTQAEMAALKLIE